MEQKLKLYGKASGPIRSVTDVGYFQSPHLSVGY